MRIGTQELIIILIVVIIIFGPTQIPKLTKMFGKSVKSFKEGMEETEEDDDGPEEAPDEDKAGRRPRPPMKDEAKQAIPTGA